VHAMDEIDEDAALLEGLGDEDCPSSQACREAIQSSRTGLHDSRDCYITYSNEQAAVQKCNVEEGKEKKSRENKTKLLPSSLSNEKKVVDQNAAFRNTSKTQQENVTPNCQSESMANHVQSFRSLNGEGVLDGQARFWIYDTETTGFVQGQDRIIELGAVEVVGGSRTGLQFHSYIWTDRQIHPQASRAHGINRKVLQNKPVPATVLSSFVNVSARRLFSLAEMVCSLFLKLIS